LSLLLFFKSIKQEEENLRGFFTTNIHRPLKENHLLHLRL
jgi:hypothetical protein